MNIYSNKRGWKIFLFLFALIIVFGSWWYTNRFLSKIAKDERQKVQIWANAISRKAAMVNYTNELFKDLQQQERKYMQQWADATKLLVMTDNEADLSFFSEFISQNNNIPVILTDEKGNINSFVNLDSSYQNYKKLTPELRKKFIIKDSIILNYYADDTNYIYYQNSKIYYRLKETLDDLVESFLNEVVENSIAIPVIVVDRRRTTIVANSGAVNKAEYDTPEKLKRLLVEMESKNPVITVEIPLSGKNYIYYQDSFFLRQMRFFPFIQFGVAALFMIVAYILFSLSRRTEQNQVWVGLAKETAHQLGTPISSLLGWNEMLKLKNVDSKIVEEISKDVERLSLVSERFSKIGSAPELEKKELISLIQDTIDYMRGRTSNKIEYSFIYVENEVFAKVNVHLFLWVLENLFKNSVDAIGGSAGSIQVEVSYSEKHIIIDVTDSGKGIPKGKFKSIFNPGFTTKKRGWGLGLSLAKRIIQNYHKGRIFVKLSIPEKSTTLRIMLRKLKE